MRPLLLLRPQPGLAVSAKRARSLGLAVVEAPLFTVEPVAWHPPDALPDALLITSANAVRHGGAALARLRNLPVHAVGAATAEAARDAGFTLVSIGSGDVNALLDSIEPAQRLLWLAGAERKAVRRDGLDAVVVYRTIPLKVQLPRLDGMVVAVHSARAAARLAELASERGACRIAAISVDAAALAGAGWESVDVAPAPTDAALLALAARLCQMSAQ